MPLPSTSDLRVDELLTSFASAYGNDRLIADRVLPVANVPEVSGKFVKYRKEDYATIPDDTVAGLAEPNQIDWSVTYGTYSCKPYSLLHRLPRETVEQASEPIDVLAKSTEYLMLQLMLARDVRVADLLTNASNYASTQAAAAVWSDTTNGKPIDDIQAALELLAPIADPNYRTVMVMHLKAWHALRKHPQMRGGGAESPLIDRAQVQSFFGVDEVVVTQLIKNTANPGASPSYADVWDKTKVAILRVPNQVGLNTRAFALAFRWSNPAFGGQPVGVEQWIEQARGPSGAQVIRATYYEDVQVVQNDMGVLITGVLT